MSLRILKQAIHNMSKMEIIKALTGNGIDQVYFQQSLWEIGQDIEDKSSNITLSHNTGNIYLKITHPNPNQIQCFINVSLRGTRNRHLTVGNRQLNPANYSSYVDAVRYNTLSGVHRIEAHDVVYKVVIIHTEMYNPLPIRMYSNSRKIDCQLAMQAK